MVETIKAVIKIVVEAVIKTVVETIIETIIKAVIEFAIILKFRSSILTFESVRHSKEFLEYFNILKNQN